MKGLRPAPFTGRTEEAEAIRAKIAMWRINMDGAGCKRRERLSRLITGAEKALADMAAFGWASNGINNVNKGVNK